MISKEDVINSKVKINNNQVLSNPFPATKTIMNTLKPERYKVHNNRV
jgi:hypothetical protein